MNACEFLALLWGLAALVMTAGWCGGASITTRATLPRKMFLMFQFEALPVSRSPTGIPFTEAQELRTRGEDHRRYQRSTPLLFPWFPRPAAEAGYSTEREHP